MPVNSWRREKEGGEWKEAISAGNERVFKSTGEWAKCIASMDFTVIIITL